MLSGKFNCYLQLLVFISFCGMVAIAQTSTYNLGGTPTAEESRAMGYSVDPSGKGLPAGSGTAKEGAQLFAQKCAACHGAGGEGTKAAPMLVGGKGTINTANPIRTVGSF
jgi:cytochrome c